MGIFSKIIGGSGVVEKVIGSVGGVIDKLHTSEEEKGKIKAELLKIQTNAEIEMKKAENEAEKIYQQELKTKTELMIAEVKSDDTFVRRVRPLVFLILTIAFIVPQVMFGMATVFGFNLVITAQYIEMMEMFKTVFLAFLTMYIGGRSMEKVTDKKANKMSDIEMITKLESKGYEVRKR